jgi:hypothetical protein
VEELEGVKDTGNMLPKSWWVSYQESGLEEGRPLKWERQLEDSTSLVLKRKGILLIGKLERQLEYSTNLALKREVV